ncbi:GIY-YIG nuclease family protein [Verrucomicrobia bacterium]|nr:GIY-YIG nuclease family protein [Verrucomicrobiota bacterium]
MKHTNKVITRQELRKLVIKQETLNSLYSKGFLYVLQYANKPDWYKIGQTSNLKSRLSHYKTHHPFEDPKFIKTYPCNRTNRAEKLAILFLNRICKDKKNREWFKVSCKKTVLDIVKFSVDKKIHCLELYDYGKLSLVNEN